MRLDATWLLAHVSLENEDERRFVRAFARDMAGLFAGHGVAHSPLLILQVADVCESYLLVRRFEDAIHEDGLFPQKKREPEGPLGNISPAVEPLGKARDRWRKAVKDLEDACARAGTPIDKGLADALKPIVRQADGVLEDALAFEAAKEA